MKLKLQAFLSSSAIQTRDRLFNGDQNAGDPPLGGTYELEHGSMGLAPPPARRLPPTSRPNSKNARVKKRPRKRAPKKKTHKEHTEPVDELSLENERLINEVEQMRKANQELKDCNVYMKSQLALSLEQRQEKNMPYPSQSSFK